MSTAGRKLEIVRSFVTNEATDSSGRTLYCCSASGCTHKRRTKDFPSAKWADHVELDYEFADDAAQLEFAQKHKTKIIMLEFNSATVSFFRKRTISEVIEDDQSCNYSNTTAKTNKSTSQNNSKCQKLMLEKVDFCDHKRAEHRNKSLSKFLVGCDLIFSTERSNV